MMVARVLGAALAALLVAATPAFAVETANLDGVWQGSLHFTPASFAFDPIPDAKSVHDVVLRVEIHGPVVNVYFGGTASPDDGLQGVFHIAQVKTNAVIFGTNYSQGDGPGWTESMTLIVTPKDDKTLLVSFSRLVNNSGDTDAMQNVKFAEHVDGALTRVGP
jgi:hypothetical protein